VATVAEITQWTRPEVLLINEFDFDVMAADLPIGSPGAAKMRRVASRPSSVGTQMSRRTKSGTWPRIGVTPAPLGPVRLARPRRPGRARPVQEGRAA
jgi:hypothetical protein